MARNETTTPAVTVDPITAAKDAVTVQGDGRKRALRDAAVKAAAEAYGPFTITEAVNLDKDKAPKFQAWITGARGYNGFIVEGKMGRAVVGLTTVQDFAALGAITNVDAFPAVKGTAVAPTMSGILA